MNVNDLNQNAKNITDNAKNAAVESTQDWLDYVQQHPVQTIVLGLACIGIGSLFRKIWPSN